MNKADNLDRKHLIQKEHNFNNQLRLTGQYVSINDHFTDALPRIKRAGLKLGNFLDIIKGRNPKYNKNEQDLETLSENKFTLAGNPVIANYDGSEQIIITNLEHEKVSSIKELVYSLSNKSRLNRYDSNMLIGRELFESLKNIPGATYLIPKQMIESGKEWDSYERRYAFLNTSQRQEFYEALAQGETQALKEYIYLINNLETKRVTKKAPKTIRNLLPFTVNESDYRTTKGLRFPYIFEMVYSDFRIPYELRASGDQNILCKIPNNIITKGKVSMLSNEEMKILTAYRNEKKIIRTKKGIYIHL